NNHFPTFTQLYIYDTEHENENRINIMQDLNHDILLYLQNMLDKCNLYIQSFRQVRNIILSNITSKISMIIHSNRTHNPHHYNAPASSDIAVIMIGDGHNIELTN
ncbi:2587_t:CDS:1, partial [Funneliformis geosporum]